jgi:hypothetical protein
MAVPRKNEKEEQRRQAAAANVFPQLKNIMAARAENACRIA